MLGKWVRAALPKLRVQQVAKRWRRKTSSCGPNWLALRWSGIF